MHRLVIVLPPTPLSFLHSPLQQEGRGKGRRKEKKKKRGFSEEKREREGGCLSLLYLILSIPLFTLCISDPHPDFGVGKETGKKRKKKKRAEEGGKGGKVVRYVPVISFSFPCICYNLMITTGKGGGAQRGRERSEWGGGEEKKKKKKGEEKRNERLHTHRNLKILSN